jgi:hypothetical protein
MALYSELLQFFKEFGSIVNTALILSLVGIAFKIFRTTIAQKNAEVAALKERMKVVETFSVDKVAEKFRALKEYYETHLRDWYESSLRQLEEEKRKAIESKEKDFQRRIEEEITRRTSLMSKYAEQADAALGTIRQLSRSQVCGSYAVVGNNPTLRQLSYFGQLSIRESSEVLLATWEIGPMKQHHEGVGLLIGNMLAFTFKYIDPDGSTSYGVVLYEVVTDDVMRGYWTGFGISQLGFEECRKASTHAQT